MIIKTISQLPDYTNTNVNDTTLFEASNQIETGKYMSQRLTFSKIKKTISDSVKSDCGLTSGIGTTHTNDINTIKNGNLTVGGTKTFSSVVKTGSGVTVTAINSAGNQALATKGYVDNKVSTTTSSLPIYIRSNSTYTSYIEPYDGNGNINNIFTDVDGSNLYMWNFSSNGYKTGDVTLRTGDTGNLVVYGFITAPKNIPTTSCWMALEAYINSKWVMIQLQPWIVGSKSQFTQYIGFNSQVKEGLKLRIVSGFTPSNDSSSYANTGLIYNQSSPNTQAKNTLYGYVIK